MLGFPQFILNNKMKRHYTGWHKLEVSQKLQNGCHFSIILFARKLSLIASFKGKYYFLSFRERQQGAIWGKSTEHHNGGHFGIRCLLHLVSTRTERNLYLVRFVTKNNARALVERKTRGSRHNNTRFSFRLTSLPSPLTSYSLFIFSQRSFRFLLFVKEKMEK